MEEYIGDVVVDSHGKPSKPNF